MKFNVYNYTSVSKNEETGLFSINKMNKWGSVYIEDDSDAKSICKKLKDCKVLDTYDMRKISVSDITSDIIEIKSKKDLKPIMRLEKINY